MMRYSILAATAMLFAAAPSAAQPFKPMTLSSTDPAQLPPDFPGESEEAATRSAATLCPPAGQPYCSIAFSTDYRAIRDVWAAPTLAPEIRDSLKSLIAKNTSDAATNWPAVRNQYRHWLVQAHYLTSPYPQGGSGTPPKAGIHSSCTHRTTTTGTPGNQVITSTLDCN
jgi:hypothetical protein